VSELEPGYGAGEAEFPPGHAEPAATYPAEAGDAVLDSRVAPDSPVAAESSGVSESRSASPSSVAAESSVVSASPGASDSRVAPDSPVAAAMAELDRLPERELGEHPDVYQRIHSELQGALAAIDDA
jgi:hypothetical protein